MLAQPVTPQPTAAPGVEASQSTWPLLQFGDSGAAVRQLQMELDRLEVFEASVDGFYGSQTEAAVQQFQRQQGLAPDGVVGAQTWQALALAQAPGAMFNSQTFVSDQILAFTPLTFSQPPPPPSPFWLLLMPLVPLLGGALTYLQRRLQGRKPMNPSEGGTQSRRRKTNRRPRP